jgi:hypothetical protein
VFHAGNGACLKPEVNVRQEDPFERPRDAADAVDGCTGGRGATF